AMAPVPPRRPRARAAPLVESTTALRRPPPPEPVRARRTPSTWPRSTTRSPSASTSDGVRVVDRGQVDVGLRDRTDAAVDDPQIDLVAHIDLEQRVLERFDGTGDIALEDEVEHVDLALGQCLGEVLEADALATAGGSGIALDGVALLGDLAGRAIVIGGDERITGARDRGQAEHLDG